MSAHLRKRTLILSGHDTSVALEPEFWDVLDDIAADNRQSVPVLVATIDAKRTPPQSLASALRVHALTTVISRHASQTALQENSP
ncbi:MULTISPECIES: ribbon-helix-helix domain-containing protein [Acetobacter]|uniref:ribbon-helix-helix domain-containing protein n=1 Tax=Acetobacter TaxID=434 RepID=UPI000A3B7048|nr:MULTISPECIES: ribbon-helix-helix domain-containing protein [Acetobacter]MBS0960291.1 ribbon-helix-helix domain-containing protein [Acetobacter thailandicus]MBS0979688.1 ribbon-helix-helix domain-containing protein [Acetobacter thailandicus]MBS0985506.1 ribbon-helix-helix domain-containing protein [Acetobacter thailandicus]MBS1003229.1 ribbon-helix-helix domain-containing protein [Acetobacter thailandicus]OUI87802.1 hypothetical protein HK11_10570 [Acetobacter sp. DmW_043]